MSTIQTLNQLFKYKPDGFIDSWRIMKPNKEGFLVGDCDDYAITLLWMLCDKSRSRTLKTIFKGKAKFLNVDTETGEKHCVLWVEGLGYTCNKQKRWKQTLIYKKNFVYSKPLILLKLAAGYFTS